MRRPIKRKEKILLKLKTYIANFFRSQSKESMMRLLSFLLVVSGIVIIYLAVLLEKEGGHYGLELAVLGVIGKGYQKNIEESSENN